MKAELLLINGDQSLVRTESVISFSFRKEAYTPYTELSAVYDGKDTDTAAVTEIKFFIDDKLVHHGTVDTLSVRKAGGAARGTLYSRGFSAMLTQNQMEPGLYTRISLDKLMNNMVAIPHVTHEPSPEESGYIYIKYGDTLWEALAALVYKQYGTYPYIRGANCVTIHQPSEPQSFTYTDRELLSVGSGISEKRLVSEFHMEDIDGAYGTYDLTDADAVARGIVRRRYFELDRQFLYAPQQAVEYRDKIACRGWMRDICTHADYAGEDLCDIVSFGSITNRRINALRITGDRKGIRTEIAVYRDRFYP